jgi:hypothetical protein
MLMFLSPLGERLGEGVEDYLLHHPLTQPLPQGESSPRECTLHAPYCSRISPFFFSQACGASIGPSHSVRASAQKRGP